MELFSLWLVSGAELLHARAGGLALFYPLPLQPTPKLYIVAREGIQGKKSRWIDVNSFCGLGKNIQSTFPAMSSFLYLKIATF